MNLPKRTHELTKQCLQAVRSDPQHNLNQNMRLRIFQSFGLSTVRKEISTQCQSYGWKTPYYIPVDFSTADQAFTWLSLITAQKVIPVWQNCGQVIFNEEDKSNDPEEMLKALENFLLGTLSADSLVTAAYSKFYRGIEGIEEYTTENQYCSLYIAFQVLQIVEAEFDSNNEERFSNPKNDFTETALKAYAGIDEKEPGRWLDQYYYNLDKWNYQPLRYDAHKVREFWEWWLIEAIPQAWSQTNQ